MKIVIDIPKEFESDYKGDKFKDFFSRVLCDIQDGTLCGNYEKEITEMFLNAFDKSKSEDGDCWIPCSERLPENEADVLLTIKGTNKSVCDGFYSKIEPCFYCFGEAVSIQEVVAWMPLPKPY